MTDKKPPVIDLHPSAWTPDWQPPLGNDPLPGGKPHIWQEFKRDRDMIRRPGEPIIGKGWPVLATVILLIAGLTYLDVTGGPEWLLAIRSMF